MADFQTDLIGYQKDVDTYASDLNQSILEAAGEADSEPDFRQLIRGPINEVLDEFDLKFDYVDTKIGSITPDEVKDALGEQGLTISDIPCDEDDLRDGGVHPDAVINACVVDYKEPGVLSTKSKREAAIGQIISYMVAVADLQNRPVSDTVGVLLDGQRFIFIHGDDFSQVETRHVNEGSVQEFSALLVGQWTALTANRLTSDFGADNPLSSDVVESLFEAVTDGDERSEKLFEEWKLLFEHVCGFEFEKGRDVLEEHYDLDLNDAEEFRKALFALYTYYALIAKLIAAEFVYYHSGPSYPSFMKKLVGRSEGELRKQMEDFEDGWIFSDAGINNFLEASLFSWYVDDDVWNEDVASAITGVVEKMRKYDPGQLRDNPDETRDVFKNLYQHMVPEELRKQLGEVFTPDWLAELTLNDAEYDGSGSMLDPACGSGTFLVFGARRKKEHFGIDEQSLADGDVSDDEKAALTKQLLSEIEGFDLNPLAVLASRANLLIELGELVDSCDSVELPVYLCDSVRPPESGDTLTGSFYKVSEVPTDGDDSNTTIKVPKEVISEGLVNDYFELAKKCSSSGLDADAFIARFEHVHTIDDDYTRRALKESYADMHRLRERDVNGIWWEIVKNRFRPRFAGQFDFVIGNPPYITLGDLPSGYRDKVQEDWKNYGIIPLDNKTGPKKYDHALLFAVKSIDKYLKQAEDSPNSPRTLSFIMPMTVQRGGKADAFRKYLANHTKVKKITDVADWEPFDVSRNRVVIITVENDGDTDFPVSCETWIGDQPDFDARLDDVRADTQQHDFIARPMNKHKPEGKWFSAPGDAIDGFEKISGDGYYKGHAGIFLAGGTGLFYVDILNQQTAKVRNTNQGGTDWGEITGVVDKDLLYPATSGRNVQRWEYNVPDTMLVPHDPQTGKAYSESDLQTKFWDTWQFLHNDSLNMEVGDRKLYGTKLKDRQEEEHYLHAVGARMFEKYKTVYKDISGGTYIDVQAATVGPQSFLGQEKPVMFSHTLMHVPSSSKEEAYYLSAVLNSSAVRAMMRAHSVLHANPRAIEEMDIPKFNASNSAHKALADLSEKAHGTTNRSGIEDDIDEKIAEVFDLSDTELDSIQDYLGKTRV